MKNSIAFIAIVALFLHLASPAFADDPPVRELPARERVFVGGFVGLSFGTFTLVSIHGHGGFRLTNRLSAGIGANYQYANDSFMGGESYSTHTYGFGAFARFSLVSDLFLHGELERLNVESRVPFVLDPRPPRTTENNPLLGLGYGLRISEKARLNVLLLYNFNNQSQVYFDNPFIRVGLDIYL